MRAAMAGGAEDLATVAARVQPTVLARAQRLPLLPALERLVPGGGLRRGSTLSIDGMAATSLALAAAAGPSRDGAWVAAVGFPSLGLLAAAELGVALERLVLVAEPDAWFAYPFWLDDRHAPDYARTVDIHRKPGYDPCELFFDPKLLWPRGRALARLVQKKLGFRTLFDVVPLDPTLVRGSHGLPAEAPSDRPVLIGDGPPPEPPEALNLTDVHALLLGALVPR